MSAPLAAHLLIVPESHVRLHDFRFQAEMYELFHRSWGCWLIHALTTPLVMAMLFVLAQQVPVAPIDTLVAGTPWPGGLALPLLVLCLAWYFALEPVAAALLVVPAVGVALGAKVLATAWGDSATTWALVGAVGLSFVQAASHAFDPIPPPLSGSARFVPLVEWLRAVPPTTLLRAAGLMAVYTLLELWASPRVWHLQALGLLMYSGYRPDLRASIAQRIEEIVADERLGNDRWRESPAGASTVS